MSLNTLPLRHYSRKTSKNYYTKSYLVAYSIFTIVFDCKSLFHHLVLKKLDLHFISSDFNKQRFTLTLTDQLKS